MSASEIEYLRGAAEEAWTVLRNDVARQSQRRQCAKWKVLADQLRYLRTIVGSDWLVDDDQERAL